MFVDAIVSADDTSVSSVVVLSTSNVLPALVSVSVEALVLFAGGSHDCCRRLEHSDAAVIIDVTAQSVSCQYLGAVGGGNKAVTEQQLPHQRCC